MSLIGKYDNGNYKVKIYSNGTKIRETEDDEFIPKFAESHDVCITKKCDGGCPFCYEGCTVDGKHGNILNPKFLDTLHPYTEIAINGNDLTHPDLEKFLIRLRDKKVICSMTVNQIHFERNQDFIRRLVDEKLIHGLGISLKTPTKEFVECVKTYSNAVIHCINGILNEEDVEILKDNGLKLLILGYKHLRRGNDWFAKDEENIVRKQNWLYENVGEMRNHFKVISFDNLAIKQLEVQRLMSEEEWDEFYMGDDGNYSFYIDLVEGTFAKNSLSMDRYPITDNIDEMFSIIKG